jgi:amino acid adenylation domain-containing protein
MGAVRCLHEIFEERAREAPHRVAVSGRDGELTYGELDARAGRLATRLRRAGVGPDVLVGLFMDRGVDLVVGLLGILKAGGAYVPIDATWPQERVRLLLADSAAPVVVSARRLADRLDPRAATPVWVDHDDGGDDGHDAPPSGGGATPANLAYAIYTSGSTGKPKGVLVEHRNVVRLFESTRDWFAFDERDVWTLFHSVSFDFSVWELWGALLHGGRVVVVPPEMTRTPSAFRDLLCSERVTVLSQTPSAFRQLVAADLTRPEPADWALRQIVFGGERLDPGILGPWMDRYGDEHPALVNMYGITETTVHVTYRRVRRADLGSTASPIGVPLPDLAVHLLDRDGLPVADGAPGELYVEGPGLARGYLRRPDLTAQRFVTRDGRRLYDSGDRARRAGGELQYLGRSDDQLQVRGYRIEPGEVEALLAAEPDVGSVTVVAHDYGDGDVRLVAFVTPRPGIAAGAAADGHLRAGLSELAAGHLPPHMRPSAYEVLEHVPMTPQGKVDRAGLHALLEAPAAGPGAPTGDGTTGAPTEVERTISAIAEDVLQCAVPLDADLFDHGVTSLAFVRIVTQVNARLGLSLTGAELGESATLAALSKYAAIALEGRNEHR